MNDKQWGKISAAVLEEADNLESSVLDDEDETFEPDYTGILEIDEE